MSASVAELNGLLIHATLTDAVHMVFNGGMDDAKLIEKLGGPAKVAALLRYGAGGVQRVHNWLTRGIPAKVKLERPDLFPVKPHKERASASHPQRRSTDHPNHRER
jgi:hypothetical protein